MKKEGICVVFPFFLKLKIAPMMTESDWLGVAPTVAWTCSYAN